MKYNQRNLSKICKNIYIEGLRKMKESEMTKKIQKLA